MPFGDIGTQSGGRMYCTHLCAWIEINTQNMKMFEAPINRFIIPINWAECCRQFFFLFDRTGGGALSGVGPVEGVEFASFPDPAAHELTKPRVPHAGATGLSLFVCSVQALPPMRALRRRTALPAGEVRPACHFTSIWGFAW
ncbi:hypothetical protein [Burkholderia sp. NLJ2]|uniref:hypothetical protein n=1 Tax=Burkholderia sp. NLJ2 TaxID=3090699 RepID=UPI003C6BFFFF